MLIPTLPRMGCAGTHQAGRVKESKVLRPQTSKSDRAFNSVTETGCGWPSFWVISQFSSVAQSYLTLFDLTDCSSTSGFPVHHQLLELTQTHVH